MIRHFLQDDDLAPDVLRLAPPLVLTDAQVDALVAALPAALDSVVVQ